MRQKAIYGAESIGTIFYKITEEQLKDFYADNKNIVLRYLVEAYGFDAFKTADMWGSYLDRSEDVIYYCRTDGQDIEVDGELVNPEQAFEDFPINALEPYIQDGTDSEIKSYFTEYELAEDFDLDEVALDLLNDGYSFSTILKDMNKLDLLDNILL